MARARAQLRKENGGLTSHSVMFNLAEYQARARSDGYRWEGTARFGGDIDKLLIKSEGEGIFGGGLETAETQVVYSRAIDPYFDLHIGARYDITPNPSRAYAVLGVEGLAPLWFDVEGQLFLSDKGDLLARVEATYDQRITQKLVAQPRAELNLAAQDVRKNRIGSGISDLELGLRVRYEVKQEFAPYVGVEFVRAFGDTARFLRAKNDDASQTNFVIGLQFWF